MHGVVPDRKRVDRRPQAPARPLPDVRVHLARDDQRDEITHLRRDDGRPAPVRLVAEVREYEDHQEG